MLHALVLVADGQGCAGLVEFLGDAPGDGTLVGQPEDHGRFACQIDHAFVGSSERMRVAGGGARDFQDISHLRSGLKRSRMGGVWGSCSPTHASKDDAWMGHRELGFVLSHPCIKRTMHGWGTGS